MYRLLGFIRILLLLAGLLFLLTCLIFEFLISFPVLAIDSVLAKKFQLRKALKSCFDITKIYFCRYWAYSLGVRLKTSVKGRVENEMLLVANHVSYLDIICLSSNFPVSYMAKQEVKSWAIVSQIVKLSGGVFVKREDNASRVRAMFQLIYGFRRRAICVFPEGTTTAHEDPSKETWNLGAFAAAYRAGASVLVCGISYGDREFAPWVGDDAFVPHLWATMCKPSNSVSLFGQVYSKQEVQAMGIRGFGEKARQEVIRLQNLAEMDLRERP